MATDNKYYRSVPSAVDVNELQLWRSLPRTTRKAIFESFENVVEGP